MIRARVTLAVFSFVLVTALSGCEQTLARRIVADAAGGPGRSRQGCRGSDPLPIAHDGGRRRSFHEPVVRRRGRELAARRLLSQRDQVAPPLGRPPHPDPQR